MIYISALLLFSVTLAFLKPGLSKYGVKYIFLTPHGVSTTFFILIHIFMPVLQWYYGFFRYQDGYDPLTYSISMFFSFLVYFLFNLGFILFNININNPLFFNIKDFNVTHFNYRYLIFYALLVFIVGFYYSYQNIIQILSMGMDVYLRDRISFAYGQGIKVLFPHWIYISCMLVFFSYLMRNSKFYLFLFLFIFVYSAVYYSINSNRNSLFILFFLLFSIYLSCRDFKINFKYIFKIMFPFFCIYILYLIGKYRKEIASSEISHNDNYGLINSLNGAFGNHENIVWLLSNQHQILLGKTYLAGFSNFIPRALWIDKPYGAGPELKNMIYPGSYVLGQEGNSSLTTGFVTELLMNYGVLISLLVSFSTGLFLCIFFIYLKDKKNLFFKIIYIYLMVLFCSQFFYAEFLGFISRTIFTLFPLLFGLIIFSIRRKS